MRQEIGIYLNKKDFGKAKEVINKRAKLANQTGNVGLYLMKCGCRLRTIEHEDEKGLSVVLFSENDKPLIEDFVGAFDFRES